MTSSAENEVLFIGVGNPLRGDDAAGALAAALIRDRDCPGLRVIEHEGEGTSLMEAWTGAQTVIVVDALSSDLPPGTICRFEAGEIPLPTELSQHSTHALGLQQAVELSRALNRLPPCLIIYGIQAKSLEIGAPLSDEVRDAIRQVVARILREL
jgi:hydrogenase maturation protease